MARLPDPTRSRAVLIGASTYQSSDLPDLPAVANNLRDLEAILTQSGGFADCIVVSDPEESSRVGFEYRPDRFRGRVRHAWIPIRPMSSQTAAIGMRLVETNVTNPGVSFLMHLDGRWGSGKSTGVPTTSTAQLIRQCCGSPAART